MMLSVVIIGAVLWGVLALVYFATVGHQSLDPVIQEGRFPFVVSYKLDGEIIRIEDVILVEYRRRRDPKFPITNRYWRTTLESTGRSPNFVILEYRNHPSARPEAEGRINSNSRVNIRISGDYFMGERWGQESPHIAYFELYEWQPRSFRSNNTILTAEQLQTYFGIELLEFEFNPRITNRFSLLERWRSK
ncbi:MAG: hypothetical protein FWC89_12575 [Defluviitaleaceae bacterium]|nr:hypothetical protein [Defluviitaleaceae bacterium]